MPGETATQRLVEELQTCRNTTPVTPPAPVRGSDRDDSVCPAGGCETASSLCEEIERIKLDILARDAELEARLKEKESDKSFWDNLGDSVIRSGETAVNSVSMAHYADLAKSGADVLGARNHIKSSEVTTIKNKIDSSTSYQVDSSCSNQISNAQTNWANVDLGGTDYNLSLIHI